MTSTPEGLWNLSNYQLLSYKSIPRRMQRMSGTSLQLVCVKWLIGVHLWTCLFDGSVMEKIIKPPFSYIYMYIYQMTKQLNFNYIHICIYIYTYVTHTHTHFTWSSAAPVLGGRCTSRRTQRLRSRARRGLAPLAVAPRGIKNGSISRIIIAMMVIFWQFHSDDGDLGSDLWWFMAIYGDFCWFLMICDDVWWFILIDLWFQTNHHRCGFM